MTELPPPKILAPFINQALEIVEASLRITGVIHPLLIAGTPSGVYLYIEDGNPDKDRFMMFARCICEAFNASAAIVAVETWIAYDDHTRSAQGIDVTDPGNPYREDIALLWGQVRNPQDESVKFLSFRPIRYSDAGEYLGLGESPPQHITEELKKRYAQVFYPNPRTQKDIMESRQIVVRNLDGKLRRLKETPF